MSNPLVSIRSYHPAVTMLTLNRPEKRNALSEALMESLCEAIDQVQADLSRRVLIFGGAGPVFCAGLDLAESKQAENTERGARLMAQTLKTIYSCRLITIAAVHGAAVAGGAGVMSACDLVVAAENARIGYPEVRRGLMAALVVSFLCHQIGERRARELVLLGQYIDARRAWEMGLVNRVVPAAQLHEATLALASEVLKGGPAAVERTKHLVNQIAPRHINERLEHALEHHLLTRNSDEAEEGLAAFVAKRAPSWDPDVQNGNAS